jgi:hypothetical protein
MTELIIFVFGELFETETCLFKRLYVYKESISHNINEQKERIIKYNVTNGKHLEERYSKKRQQIKGKGTNYPLNLT